MFQVVRQNGHHFFPERAKIRLLRRLLGSWQGLRQEVGLPVLARRQPHLRHVERRPVARLFGKRSLFLWVAFTEDEQESRPIGGWD